MATAYASMPAAWSNKRAVERLRKDAFESLTRMLSRAVAETGVNFSIWSALRTNAEQHALFVKNYRNRGTSRRGAATDRKYKGTWWQRVGVSVAVPGSARSNHEGGRAIDIYPGAIQDWIRANGLRFGWNWEAGRRQNEAWHFEYRSRDDQYRAEGLLDHAAVQRAVGAEVDGKIGTGTVAKIRAFQAEHGLEVDGKVGPATKAVMLGKGAAEQAEETVKEVVEAVGVLGDAVAGLFPWADSDSQAFDGKYPTQKNLGGKPKGLLHSTESGGWPGYDGGSVAPHMTVLFDPTTKTIAARQHFRTDRPSRALANANGGVQTNNWNVFQIELVGTCDRSIAARHGFPYLPDLLAEPWARDALAAVLAAVSSTLDIPLTSTVDWAPYPGSYGLNARQRLTGAEWEAYTGWLGHQHVPENTHGDPGDLPVSAILAAANGGAGAVITTPAAPAPSTLPTGKALLMALFDAPDFPLLRTPGHLCYYGGEAKQTSVSGKVPNSLVPGEIEGSGDSSGAKGLKVWQAQMNSRGYSLAVDGRFGDDTEKAAKNLQRLAGITQDGAIGPDTWFAAFLLPVVS